MFPIHYLAKSEDGPIKTTRNVAFLGNSSAVTCQGGRWAVACQPRRKYLSRLSASGKVVTEFFLATGDWRVVTCSACQKAALFLRDVQPVPEQAGV